MFIVYEMECEDRPENRSAIEPVLFTPEYKDAYKKMYNGCYREMREALGIRPVDFISDDSFFDEGMDCVYLLIDNGELIGSVALKGSEIDDLIVDPGYQGRGYGKELLLWALEHMPEGRLILHVAEWNARAIALYEKYGFRISKRIEIR